MSSSPSPVSSSFLSSFPSFLLHCLPTSVHSYLSSLSFEQLQNSLVTSGYLPDPLLRSLVRSLLRQRLNECHSLNCEALCAYKHLFVMECRKREIAEATERANEQHYEVPPHFYQKVLGLHLKYSCAYYRFISVNDANESLEQAEENMLHIYVERARLSTTRTQCILDLGCGWGSFTLFVAALLPQSHFVGVSNSHSQRDFIMQQARQRGLDNVFIVTCDINHLTPAHLKDAVAQLKGRAGAFQDGQDSLNGALSHENNNCSNNECLFDRIVSIEMFEHMKNYEALLVKCQTLLKPFGLLFVHIFVHREYPYHFGNDSWMSRYFFSGGTMPSADLLLYFLRAPVHLQLKQTWAVSGQHYARTSRQWLERLDAQWSSILQYITLHNSQHVSSQADYISPAGFLRMWRVFFIAVEELFALNKGEEWFVQHYLFENPNKQS